MLFTTIMLMLAAILILQTSSDCATQSKKQTTTETKGKSGFEVLQGRWLRPDGGYIIQVKSVDSGGKMDAGYFNPRPINVSKAQATKDGSKMKVFVELSDVGYPGSTYTLSYDPKEDVLRGVYYQAVVKQSYDVYFTRMK
jgi:hypothetical protein